jgi:bifunctional enzyme CysN/CysC
MAPEGPAAGLPAPLLRPRLRFMTCGSVDDGKSTLIGRLLVESGAVFEDHLLEATRAGLGSELEFAFLVDGLKAEREQGITIDVAYRYFATPKRAFLIADAPGHQQYTRNQAAAASQAELAVVLVSARDGVQPQTRRHMAIASLFGLKAVVFAVNKMDLVGHAREPFTTIVTELRTLAVALNLDIVAEIPVSARDGDNVASRSTASPWYDGPTLLEVLERFEPAARIDGPTLLPIAMTGRLDGGGRVSYGEIAAGKIAVGDVLRAQDGLTATVAQLWGAGSPVREAAAGAAVAVALTPEIDLGRGAVLSAPDAAPALASQLRLRCIWLASETLQMGRRYDLELATGDTSVTVSRIERRLDLDALTMSPIDDDLHANDIAVIRVNLATPLPAMPFRQNRQLGAFIMIDRVSRRTVAAGCVLSIERLSGDTPWQVMQVTSADRALALNQKPFVIWLTGLSGAGKSTIADLLDRRLHALGRHATVLDGDNLRRGLNADLGFSEADRSENIRRVGQVANLMANSGLITIVSLISPFRQDRAMAREAVGRERFLEVFVDAPLEVCQQRDPKGMYARAMAGNLPRFTGVASGYEAPEAPDLHLRTAEISPLEAVEQVVAALRERGLKA